MTSKLTREKAQWLHDACEEAADAGIKLTMNPNELLMFTSYALAAMDSEPVAWTDEQELRDVDRGGCGYLFTVNPVTPHADERRIILLYRHAQPASVVPEALQSLRTIVADPRRLPRRKEWIGGQQYSFVLLEEVEAIVEDACRAAMLNGGE